MREIRRRVQELDKRQSSFETYVRLYIQKNDETIAKLEAQMAEFKEDSKRRDEQFHSLIFNASIAWGVGIVSVIITIILATR